MESIQVVFGLPTNYGQYEFQTLHHVDKTCIPNQLIPGTKIKAWCGEIYVTHEAVGQLWSCNKCFDIYTNRYF